MLSFETRTRTHTQGRDKTDSQTWMIYLFTPDTPGDLGEMRHIAHAEIVHSLKILHSCVQC